MCFKKKCCKLQKIHFQLRIKVKHLYFFVNFLCIKMLHLYAWSQSLYRSEIQDTGGHD